MRKAGWLPHKVYLVLYNVTLQHQSAIDGYYKVEKQKTWLLKYFLFVNTSHH